jgi:hypothetical protein
MLEIIKNYIAKRDAKLEYQEALKRFLEDGRVDASHERYLEHLASQYGIDKAELRRFHQNAVSAFFEKVANDESISDGEKKALRSVVHIIDPETTTFDFTREKFGQHYWLALIEKGILPALEKRDLDSVLQKKEVLHWSTGATLKKWTREITAGINLGNCGGSVRLMPGNQFQIGSLKATPIVQDVLTNDDTGKFWLTDRRVGFVGQKKKFAISFNKAASFDVFQDGIAIRINGRKTPQVLGLGNAECSAAVLSVLLNAQMTGPHTLAEDFPDYAD